MCASEMCESGEAVCGDSAQLTVRTRRKGCPLGPGCFPGWYGASDNVRLSSRMDWLFTSAHQRSMLTEKMSWPLSPRMDSLFHSPKRGGAPVIPNTVWKRVPPICVCTKAGGRGRRTRKVWIRTLMIIIIILIIQNRRSFKKRSTSDNSV